MSTRYTSLAATLITLLSASQTLVHANCNTPLSSPTDESEAITASPRDLVLRRQRADIETWGQRVKAGDFLEPEARIKIEVRGASLDLMLVLPIKDINDPELRRAAKDVSTKAIENFLTEKRIRTGDEAHTVRTRFTGMAPNEPGVYVYDVIFKTLNYGTVKYHVWTEKNPGLFNGYKIIAIEKVQQLKDSKNPRELALQAVQEGEILFSFDPPPLPRNHSTHIQVQIPNRLPMHVEISDEVVQADALNSIGIDGAVKQIERQAATELFKLCKFAWNINVASTKQASLFIQKVVVQKKSGNTYFFEVHYSTSEKHFLAYEADLIGPIPLNVHWTNSNQFKF